MKKFILLLCLLVITASFLLKFNFNYPWNTVGSHLAVMTLLLVAVCSVNLLTVLLLKNKMLSSGFFHVTNFLFLTALITFYLLVIGSNYFWHKTITIAIMKNYFASIGEFIAAVPIQKELVLAVPVLLLFLIAGLYYLYKPAFETWRSVAVRLFPNKKKILLFSLGAAIALLLFATQLLSIKRRMHFADEPLLVFTFGSMWQGTGEQLAFDRMRYENGLQDKACLAAVKPKSEPYKQSFVVILIDGLRNDHLPFYGYHRNTTPFLDSLRKAGHLSVVKNAFSPSNNTIGGIAGLFYSRDWDKFGYNGLNIPKFLKKLGYTNYAFLTGFHKEWYGLSALYRNDCDYYYESSMNYEESNRVDDDMKTLDVLKNTKLSGPAFLYIHLLSVHHVGKKYDTFRRYRPDKLGFGVDKKEALINNYDNGILQTDYIIKEIFSKLSASQILPNSTVFIVADHGELFGEDGRWSHGGDLHEKLLEIPLLVYDKKRQLANTEAGSLLDIGPTIAGITDQNVPACWQGFSLLKPAQDFTLKVYSNDDNIRFPHGFIEKKDSLYQFSVVQENGSSVQVRQKRNGNWITKDHELSEKNNSYRSRTENTTTDH